MYVHMSTAWPDDVGTDNDNDDSNASRYLLMLMKEMLLHQSISPSLKPHPVVMVMFSVITRWLDHNNGTGLVSFQFCGMDWCLLRAFLIEKIYSAYHIRDVEITTIVTRYVCGNQISEVLQIFANKRKSIECRNSDEELNVVVQINDNVPISL